MMIIWQRVKEAILWVDDHMPNFSFYLFSKYVLICLTVHWTACIGFGWVVLATIFLVLREQDRKGRRTKLDLAYASTKTLRRLWDAFEAKMPSWVSNLTIS